VLSEAFLLFIFIARTTSLTPERENAPITYSSSVTIIHKPSKLKLYSSKITWGSGSGQQAVTAMEDRYDSATLWLVKEGHSESPKAAGDPVPCGALIRLEHLDSLKNLHSHLHKSPVSNNLEVSAFGENGEGDSGDSFVVECPKGATVWTRMADVYLKHKAIGNYLSSNKNDVFTQRNCPRCPIVGHQEVVVLKNSKTTPGDNETWRASDGVILSKETEDVSDKKHDEL